MSPCECRLAFCHTRAACVGSARPVSPSLCAGWSASLMFVRHIYKVSYLLRFQHLHAFCKTAPKSMAESLNCRPSSVNEDVLRAGSIGMNDERHK